VNSLEKSFISQRWQFQEAATAAGVSSYVCTPPNSCVEVLTQIPQNVTIFGDIFFKEVTKVK
jgi:hypothetical protein